MALHLTSQQREEVTRNLVACLSSETEIRRIVILGSFVDSEDPHDVDVAVFHEGNDEYLPLALKYRKMTRQIAGQIPLDIISLKAEGSSSAFLVEINRGVTVYER